MKNMKLIGKLSVVFFILFLLVGAVSFVSWRGIISTGATFDKYLANEGALAETFAEMLAQGLQSEQAVRNVLLNPSDATAAKNYSAAVESVTTAIAKATRLSKDNKKLLELLTVIEKTGVRQIALNNRF